MYNILRRYRNFVPTCLFDQEDSPTTTKRREWPGILICISRQFPLLAIQFIPSEYRRRLQKKTRRSPWPIFQCCNVVVALLCLWFIFFFFRYRSLRGNPLEGAAEPGHWGGLGHGDGRIGESRMRVYGSRGFVDISRARQREKIVSYFSQCPNRVYVYFILLR